MMNQFFMTSFGFRVTSTICTLESSISFIRFLPWIIEVLMNIMGKMTVLKMAIKKLSSSPVDEFEVDYALKVRIAAMNVKTAVEAIMIAKIVPRR